MSVCRRVGDCSTVQFFVVTLRHLYSISAHVPQLSFRGETSSGIAKCQLFSVFKTSDLRFVFRNTKIFQSPC